MTGIYVASFIIIIVVLIITIMVTNKAYTVKYPIDKLEDDQAQTNKSSEAIQKKKKSK